MTRKRNTLTTNLLLIFSWLMALLISLPMFVEKEGFSNWPTSVRKWVERCRVSDQALVGEGLYFFFTFKWTVRIILRDKEGPVLFTTVPLKLLSDIYNVTMLTIWGNSTEITRNLFPNSLDLVSRNSWGHENPGNLL